MNDDDSIQYQFSYERDLYDKFAPGVAYVAVEDSNECPGIGTCFHIGENVFITARHAVEGRKITKLATTNAGVKGSYGNYVTSFTAGEAGQISAPLYHANENYDLAALRVSGLPAPQIPFLPIVDDRFENKLIMRPVVIMGFPPLPGSSHPVLVSAKCEVNATFVTYFDQQRVYVVSCLARGGFSGGPALTPPHHCLGVITRAVLKDPLPEELGFMAVVGPIHYRARSGFVAQRPSRARKKASTGPWVFPFFRRTTPDEQRSLSSPGKGSNDHLLVQTGAEDNSLTTRAMPAVGLFFWSILPAAEEAL